MPQPPNRFLRLLVPFIVVGLGVGVALAFFLNTTKAQQRQSAQGTTAPATPEAPPPTPEDAGTRIIPAPGAQATPDAAAIPVPPPETAGPLGTLRVLPAERTGDMGELGSIDPASGYAMRVRFSMTGAGVAEIALADHNVGIRDDTRVLAQHEQTLVWNGVTQVLTPLAATEIEVARPGERPQALLLAAGVEGPVWSPLADAPGAAELRIADDQGRPVLRVVRRYHLEPNSHMLRLEQRVENLTAGPLVVRFFQLGPVDLDQDLSDYGGDKRRVRFGYLLAPKLDPARQTVVADRALTPHSSALGSRTDAGIFPEKVLWPSEDIASAGSELSWAGMTNRYFGAAVTSLFDPDAPAPDKRLAWVGAVARVVLDAGPGREILALRLDGAPVTVPAGRSAALDLGFFAGPLSRGVMNAEPLPRALGLSGLIVYNFGGMCAFCTFAPITGLLVSLLLFLHNSIFLDWSLAIIFLVVIVRTCLHPVTRWSQIRMAIFGKQMQAMAPKQKELQEKFRGDPKKLQEETARLWREEGISPAGFLGCLPAFLQTPIWIALYATLYFAVELRHQAAFYGLFQLQPDASPFWQFLGDLSRSDRFIYFGHTLVELPLLGPVDAINILPLLLGVVFFIQQKYLTPPTGATLTPEQQLQQKMMKWMMVVMFPLFMYNAPSGLSLYFITNSTLAILESKWIRAHMDKHGMLDLDKIKAARNAKRAGAQTRTPQGEGFFARLQRQIEEKQKQAQQQALRNAKRQGKRKP